MPTIEIDVDPRGRASLKSAGVAPGRYRITQIEDSFKLTPVTSYTQAELLALNDDVIQKAHRDARDGVTEFVTSDELP